MKPRLLAVAVLLITLTITFSFSLSARGTSTTTVVGGPITVDTVWTVAGSPYIVTPTVQILSGVTLTIEPGVVVKLDTDQSLHVEGTLIARGTAQNPITFTSNALTPQPGDWGAIEFTDTAVDAAFDSQGEYVSGSVLSHCAVEYADGAHWPEAGAIETFFAAPFIEHCMVHDNLASGVRGRAADGTWLVIRQSMFERNSNMYGGGLDVERGQIISNTISHNYGQFGGGVYVRDSILARNVIADNFAYQGGGIEAVSSNLIDNVVQRNKASADGGGIRANYGQVVGNYLWNNLSFNDEGGGLYASTAVVMSNTIQGNLATGPDSCGGGVYVAVSDVIANVIAENATTGAVSNGGGMCAMDVNMVQNTIVFNQVPSTGQGSGAYVTSASKILSNTIVGNRATGSSAAGLAVDFWPSEFHHNNLYGNTHYDVRLLNGNDVNGADNFWGTTQTAEIDQRIYDWYDDPSLGKLLYTPVLSNPARVAPVPPPLNLRADTTREVAALQWDSVPHRTDTYQYRVYYSTNGALPPYAGMGLPQGNSPIEIGSALTITLTGLDVDQVYYLTVTAIDDEGRESWYSAPLNNLRRVFLPVVIR